MCQGTVISCRSCRQEAVHFYSGGRCGEAKPFPSWHTIRGHTRKVRRCHNCIQSHRRALVRAQEDSIRDARRAKSLGQYLRRERRHPLPDEESHLQSNGNYILQTFDLVSEDGAEVEADANQDSITQSPHQVSDAEQDTTEINYWDEYQAGRRLHPFNNIAAQEEFLFFRSVAQACPENEILALLMDRLEECLARQVHMNMTGRALNVNDQHYVFGHIRFEFDQQMATLSQIPPGSSGAEYPTGSLQATPIGSNEEDEDYREPEPPEVSFYDWTIRSCQQDTIHNEGLSTQDALERDLDNYDWYLRQYCTDLQANDFRRRRAEIANREYDFDHVNLDLPFSQWLTIENRVRIRNDTELLTCPIHALDVYCNEVIWEQTQEVRDAFADSRARHFEENRREFYGHTRDEHCQLIERLRGVRANTLQMVSWSEQKLPELINVQINLDQICQILTSRIAMEMEPTEEQWTRTLETGREAVREMKEAKQVQPDRQNNWRHLYAELTENWDHEFETQVGDVDGEIQEAPRVCSSFLGQELQGEPEVERSDSSEPGLWLNLDSEQIQHELSPNEDENEEVEDDL
ncbi:hypothetical protein N431DRAFT_466749 [Stipitochalara longipes BDJ]|nr:hypothetical protein N431DRAFT_466749 [Stipitochalara longipes BDJ]